VAAPCAAERASAADSAEKPTASVRRRRRTAWRTRRLPVRPPARMGSKCGTSQRGGRYGSGTAGGGDRQGRSGFVARAEGYGACGRTRVRLEDMGEHRLTWVDTDREPIGALTFAQQADGARSPCGQLISCG
jgi:hypothetical protein